MPYNADGTWKAEDDSVQTQFTDITSKNSPLMQQAKTQAKQESGSRGLLNSSMGVQAGQEAAYKVALPMASQNASQISSKNLSEQGYTQQQGLLSADHTNKMELTNTNIASDQFMQQQTIDHQANLAELDTTSKERIAAMNTSAYDKEKATSALVAMEATYMQNFLSLANNTDLPKETRDAYVAHLNSLRDSNNALIEQMYAIDLDWAQPTSGATP